MGKIGPLQWQPPHNPQFATGVWQYCWALKEGMKGGEKMGGGGAEKGGIVGPNKWGGEDGGLAPDCEFLSVKIDDSRDETPSLGQTTSSLSSLTSSPASSFSFSSSSTSSITLSRGDADSFCNFALADLASVFWWLRSFEIGRSRLAVRITWNTSSLLVLLQRPPLSFALASEFECKHHETFDHYTPPPWLSWSQCKLNTTQWAGAS